MRTDAAIGLIAAATAVLLVLGAVSARAQSPWSDQTIVAIPEFSLTDSAVQIDAQNRPHVFVGGDRVYHYWLDGGVWNSEVVDDAPRSGQRLRVATGPSGEFHLVYDRHDLSPESSVRVMYVPVTRRHATNLTGTWRVEEVPPPAGDTPTQYKVVTGLVVDAGHQPRVLSYSVDTLGPTQDLYLQSRSTGGWSSEPINDDPALGQAHTATSFSASSQLAIDAAGRIHAIWFTANGDKLVYARRDTSGWHHELLESVAGTALVPYRDPSSLVVDASGSPHIFLNNSLAAGGGHTHFLHLAKVSGIWQVDDLGVSVYQHASAIDAQGRAHVVSNFSVGTSGTEVGTSYARQSDTGWTTEPLPLDATYATSASLRVDALGRAHVAALIDATPDFRSLRYLRRDAVWGAELEIARSGPVIFDSDYQARSSGAMVGADVRIGLWEGRRRLVYRTGGLSGGVSFPYRSIEQPGGAFSQELLPFNAPVVEPRTLAYAIGPNGDEYVIWVSGSGLQGVVDAEYGPQIRSFVGASIGWSARSSSRPGIAVGAGGSSFHALFAGVQGGDSVLGHFEYSAGLYGINPVAAAPELIGDERLRTLAISPPPLGAGTQYAAYVDAEGRVARARNDGSGWTTEVIGAPPFDTLIGSHSIAVEPDGTVHIAYERFNFAPLVRDYIPWGLAYGSNRCHGEFYVTEVDPRIAPSDITVTLGSKNPDLVLDPVGNPHIAYRHDADRSLGYAHIAGGVFALETVVPNTYSHEQSALAVEANGRVSLGHHDPWAGDLRLATRAPSSLEPRWDGCPPLPDPDEVLDGSYVLTTPPGEFPLYDPGGDFDESYGTTHALFFIDEYESGKFNPSGAADWNGDAIFDADLTGKGQVSGNGSKIRVKRKLAIRDRDLAEAPNGKLRISRVEQIDPFSRSRTIIEKSSGQIGGQKVRVKRTFTDEVPREALGIRLELEITSSADGLAVHGYWLTRDSGAFELTGTGTWSSTSDSAELHLGGKKIDIRLSGVRVWRTEADGTHLRADTVSVRGLGQKVSADLSTAY